MTEAQTFMPSYTFIELQRYLEVNQTLHHWESYWPLLQYKLISTSNEELSQIYEVEEGLQYRLKEAARTSTSFANFITAAKTKRYTLTRLQRICVHILIGANKIKIKQLLEQPSYLRILGFTEQGRKYLNEKKKQIELPLITKVSNFEHDALSLDIKAAIIHSLILPADKQQSAFQREYRHPVII